MSHFIGLNTETLTSSLTNLSNQSANAAINSLDQFFSSLSSTVSSRGSQLFAQLEDLKVSMMIMLILKVFLSFIIDRSL